MSAESDHDDYLYANVGELIEEGLSDAQILDAFPEEDLDSLREVIFQVRGI